MQTSSLTLVLVSLAVSTAAGNELVPLLEKAGRSATAFTEQFPSVACTEKVTQIKFGEGQKILTKRESVFDYLILLSLEGSDLTVEESRLEKSKAQKDPQQPLLSTTGFAVMVMIFHPHFQSSYKFEEIEPETREGITWRRVRFEHQSGQPSPSVLEVRGREYPLAWRGVAWLDTASGRVGRIQAELREPLEDIGLQQLKSDVEYTAHPDTGGAAAIWLPRAAAIEAHTRHQHWRNVHEFTSYRRFEVSAQQTVQEVKEH
ncbi:MAG: hypothetical protein HZB13_20895 [Acidobacteria bacterium]|nr:hypothetical protein [Acidobacteriota bacterium]